MGTHALRYRHINHEIICTCMILTQPEEGWRFCRKCREWLKKQGSKLRFTADGRIKVRK